jgi:hypothetical protein
LGSTPESVLYGNRVAAMMPCPENDRKYKALSCGIEADRRRLKFLGTKTATESDSSTAWRLVCVKYFPVRAAAKTLPVRAFKF